MIQISTFNNIWTDPVWSKVISWIIILITTQVFVLIWSLIRRIKFVQVYVNIYKGIKDFSKKKSKTSADNKESETVDTTIRIAPTVFFHQRICEAFPGLNYGHTWFTNKKDIHRRLKILLKHPTKFDSADGFGVTSDPVWWFRGGSALYIDSFKILSRKKVLLNIDELIIDKICVFRGRSYYQDFVYVECLPDKPIGLYTHDQEYINEAFDYHEEYGIFKKRIIKREELDDGSAIIKGKPVKVTNAELRTRSLKKYNFIIAAKTSPYNSRAFNVESRRFFPQLFDNEELFNQYIDWMNVQPKNRYDE